MRDLYKRLDISPSSSAKQIEAATLNCDHAGLKRDASTILLNDDRRRAYDKIHSELTYIGTLRAKLGLNHSDNWKGDAANDFSFPSDKTRSKHDILIAKLKPSISQRLIGSIIRFIKGILISFGPIILIFGGIWLYGELSQESPPQKSPTSVKNEQQRPKINLPVQPLPYSGSIRRYSKRPGEAPLQINTSEGSNYLVKLVNSLTGKTVLDVFIRGGDSIDLKVPLGDYVIKYATGNTWYGYKHLFGPSTGYSKANKTFSFEIVGNKISGYSITLYRVINGNLTTSTIPATDF